MCHILNQVITKIIFLCLYLQCSEGDISTVPTITNFTINTKADDTKLSTESVSENILNKFKAIYRPLLRVRRGKTSKSKQLYMQFLYDISMYMNQLKFKMDDIYAKVKKTPASKKVGKKVCALQEFVIHKKIDVDTRLTTELKRYSMNQKLLKKLAKREREGEKRFKEEEKRFVTDWKKELAKMPKLDSDEDILSYGTVEKVNGKKEETKSQRFKPDLFQEYEDEIDKELNKDKESSALTASDEETKKRWENEEDDPEFKKWMQFAHDQDKDPQYKQNLSEPLHLAPDNEPHPHYRKVSEEDPFAPKP